MSDWIRCEDRLPEEGVWMLVWIPDGAERPYIFYHIDHIDERLGYSPFWTDGSGQRFYDFDGITHWAPLPEPPEEANDVRG